MPRRYVHLDLNERRAVHRKMILHPKLKLAVVDALKSGWSSEQIAGRMKLEDHPVCVSYETINRFAYSKSSKTNLTRTQHFN